jgi:hypothetical protein
MVAPGPVKLWIGSYWGDEKLVLYALSFQLDSVVRCGSLSCSARVSQLFGAGLSVVRRGSLSCSARVSQLFCAGLSVVLRGSLRCSAQVSPLFGAGLRPRRGARPKVSIHCASPSEGYRHPTEAIASASPSSEPTPDEGDLRSGTRARSGDPRTTNSPGPGRPRAGPTMRRRRPSVRHSAGSEIRAEQCAMLVGWTETPRNTNVSPVQAHTPSGWATLSD